MSRVGTLGRRHFPANRDAGVHFPPWGCARISRLTALSVIRLMPGPLHLQNRADSNLPDRSFSGGGGSGTRRRRCFLLTDNEN